MFTTAKRNLKLISRNEGKIKTYDSCSDVRAWSHDIYTRGCYLRDWIKCDMPISVIPMYTVASLLKEMTRKYKGKITPRCHPECRSKVILDTIYTSCHAIKDCLKDEDEFTKYFEEEEFETSHWPCERCLEALKSIKMFWKVIYEKIFNVSVPVNDSLSSSCSSRTESSKNIAISWQNEIVHQAIFVKKLIPLLRRHFDLKSTNGVNCITIKYGQNEDNFDNNYNTIECKGDYYKDKTTTAYSRANSINSNGSSENDEKNKTEKSVVSTRVKTVDFGCNTIYDNNNGLEKYKNDLDNLQQRFNLQSNELRRLKSENNTLKLKLQTCSKNSLSSYTLKSIAPDTDDTPLKPFECEESEDAKIIESNTIITLKTSKNKNFKHVAMLQVMHETNANIFSESRTGGLWNKQEENPIEILSRVKNTFRKIVNREIDKVTQGKYNDVIKSDINASIIKRNVAGSVHSSNMATTGSCSSSSKFI